MPTAATPRPPAGVARRSEQRRRSSSPANQDLGAETPEEIALTIVAEVQGVMNARSAKPPRERRGGIHDPDSAAERPRVGAVVLAAGGSTRLGHAKQLVMLDGRPLVARAAEAAVEAGAEPVVVVLGAHADAVGAALTGLAVHPVVHAGWEDGLGSSLGGGVSALAARAPAADAVLVTLTDQPLVAADDLRRLVDAWASAADRDAAIAAAAYADTVGVPAVFGRAHWAALCALPSGAGAGGLLRAAGDRVVRVPVPGAAFDVDTPDDLARLQARSSVRAAGPPAAGGVHPS